MRVELVTQPDATSSNLYEFLATLLRDPGITRVVAVTAWVNHRGLARLVPDLREFRSRHGTTEIIVGMDEGGATEQGLRLAASEFDRSAVFFTTEERTFHPKLYFGTGADKALLFVGSSNLTPGGLFFNFEAGIVLEIAVGTAASREELALAGAVNDYLDRLYGDVAVCKPLVSVLEEIIRDPVYRVRDESAPRGRRGFDPTDPDSDNDRTQLPPLFGRSARPPRARVAPGNPIPARALGVGAVPDGPAAVQGSSATGARRRGSRGVAGASAAGAPEVVRRRWSRPFDATAAQHPPTAASNVTGNLRLTQANQPIDKMTYFRNEFFGALAWIGVATAQGLRETATAVMDVIIDGRSLGIRDFDISHAAWREEGQRNVPTVLHLEPIAAELRATNYTDRVVTIELLRSGQYRLVIDTVTTGPFIR